MGESIELFRHITDFFNIQNHDLNTYSPLTLAYIGDAIYEAVIRTIVITKDGNSQVNKLHKRSSNLVKAETQARIIHLVMDDLLEEEIKIYKRGRNAKSFTSAKNASIGDYRTATGLEALIGYLYMDGKLERALEIIKLGLEKIETE